MTAIFVYAQDDVAFVASDTKRQIHGYATVAPKTQRWSENIIISQAGFGEGLQRLVGELMSWQHRSATMLTGAGIVHAFNQVAAERLQAEIARLHRPQGQHLIGGTLIVAEAAKNGSAAQILTLDWRPGTSTPQLGPVYADGSDQHAFMGIAQAEFSAMGSGTRPFDLAAWGMACIAKAQASASGVAVDWPVDLTICRIENGIPVSVTQRVANSSDPTHPMFVI